MDFDKEKALRLIKELGIDINQSFNELSKGTKEKLQIILVLSRNAKVFIFDEPIAGVDPAARDVIFQLILNGKNDDSTIIICTHLISEVENILDEIGQMPLPPYIRFLRQHEKLSAPCYGRKAYRNDRRHSAGYERKPDNSKRQNCRCGNTRSYK